jgi:hypothetical protein
MNPTTVTIEGYADYGGFVLQDANVEMLDVIDSANVEDYQDGICTGQGGISFITSDKCHPLHIEISLLNEAPAIDAVDIWDSIVETSLELTSNRVIFTAAPDGEEDPFGTFPLEQGTYNLRIYLRSVNDVPSEEREGLLEYKIHIWSGEPLDHNVIR